MFDFIRTHQRLMQLVLLILILPSFVLIGVSGYTNYVSGDQELAKVGDSAVTTLEYDQARRQQLEQMQQTLQGGFDPELLENPAVRKALIESLIDRRIVLDAATRYRFNVSDDALRQSIAAIPQLQVDGRFSPERYNEVLASVGLNTRDFEQGQRAELAMNRVLGPVAATASVPAVTLKQLDRALSEQRTVRLRTFSATDYSAEIRVTPDDIQTWYNQNASSLELPEQVSVDYLLLNEEAALAGLPAVSEADLTAYYNQNKARYVQPGRVNVSHIQFNIPSGANPDQVDQVRAKAQAVHDQVAAAPDTFADIAREQSEDAGSSSAGGVLGWISPGSWPAEFEKAVFALAQGSVSPVVQGPSGFHIFKANEIQPEKGETFEEARAKVEHEVRRQLAAERFADMATRLTNLVYDNPSSLAPAADGLGLKIRHADGIARDRLLPAAFVQADNPASASPDSAVLGDDRVRRAVFSASVLNEKQNSGVIEISPDTLVVFRVDALVPAQVPPLEKVTDLVRDRLVAERARTAARQAGEQWLAALKASQPDQAALDLFQTPLDISRINPQGIDQATLEAVFSVAREPLPAFTGTETPAGYVVAQVTRVQAGDESSPVLASLPLQLNSALGNAEEQAVLKALRQQAGVTLLPEAEAVIEGKEQR
ncbi:MAG: peptidylprolyl isomerase [Alcaligenaceae bacterium]|nr:peptidylprolyl isomerase [Alcaligenaceae bacterium]